MKSASVTDLTMLWADVEHTFIAAQSFVPDGKRFVLGARLARGKRQTWFASVGEDWVHDEAFERAGLALARLAGTMHLIDKPSTGVVEIVRAERWAGEFVVWVESLPEESASVRLFVRASDVEDFSASRRWNGRARTAWDAACRKRLIRNDPRGNVCVIEPGIVWFVEWFEAAGARTIYSCEGHPQGFHVTFRGSYELAHQLAGVPNLMVEIFRSGAFPELGQWQLRLRNEPSDRNQRNDYLRRVTDALGKIAGAAGAASPNA